MFSGTSAGPLHSQPASHNDPDLVHPKASLARQIQACIGRLGIA